VKILTLNTWQERGFWDKRWEVIFDGLKGFSPEIAVFQELFSPSWAREVQQRAGFKNLVLSKEPCGLAIYTNYPVLASGELLLFQSPAESYPRGVIWAKVDAKKHPLFVFCTHLSWKEEDAESRRKQLREILALIRQETPSGELLIAGDFNAAPISPEMDSFVKQGPFRDLYREKHPSEEGFTWDNKRNYYVAQSIHKLPDRRIDCVFACGKGPVLAKLASCDLIFEEPRADGVLASDHFGVLAKFK